jgi:hypothetical protein
MTTPTRRIVLISLMAVLSLFTHELLMADELREVSLMELIANPDEYNGDDVQVYGYVHLDKPPLYEETSDAVYLNKDDSVNFIGKNGLFLSIPANDPKRSSFKDGYKILEGRFSKDKGEREIWSGSLSQISRIEPWPPSKSKRSKRAS